MSKFNWDDLRYFLALAEERTLSAAARSVNVTHATMARRIAQLDHQIGSPNFDQKPSGYFLTPGGLRIYELAIEMRKYVTKISDIAEPSRAIGKVRLSATPYLCNEIIRLGLKIFIESHPEIELELQATTQNVNLLRHEAHLALRLARPEKGDFIIRRVGEIRYGLYRAAGSTVGQNSAPIVAYTEDFQHLPEASWIKKAFPDNRVGLLTNTLPAQITAIKQDIGIGMIPIYAAEVAGGLERLDAGDQPWVREVWLVMRETLSNVPRIRLVSDFLFDSFKSWRL